MPELLPLLLLLLVSSGGVKAHDHSSQRSSGTLDTTTWHVYQNKPYLYNIKYPPSSTLDSTNSRKVLIKFSQRFDSSGSSGVDEFSFTISVHDNPRHLTLREWMYKNVATRSDSRHSPQELRVGGIRGVKISVFELDQEIDHIFLLSGNSIYELSFWDPDTMSEFEPGLRNQYAAIFRAIVNSFNLGISR